LGIEIYMRRLMPAVCGVRSKGSARDESSVTSTSRGARGDN